MPGSKNFARGLWSHFVWPAPNLRALCVFSDAWDKLFCREIVALMYRFLAAALCKTNKIDGVEAENGGIWRESRGKRGETTTSRISSLFNTAFSFCPILHSNSVHYCCWESLKRAQLVPYLVLSYILKWIRKLNLGWRFFLQKLRFLGRLWTDWAKNLGDLWS